RVLPRLQSSRRTLAQVVLNPNQEVPLVQGVAGAERLTHRLCVITRNQHTTMVVATKRHRGVMTQLLLPVQVASGPGVNLSRPRLLPVPAQVTSRGAVRTLQVLVGLLSPRWRANRPPEFPLHAASFISFSYVWA